MLLCSASPHVATVQHNTQQQSDPGRADHPSRRVPLRRVGRRGNGQSRAWFLRLLWRAESSCISSTQCARQWRRASGPCG